MNPGGYSRGAFKSEHFRLIILRGGFRGPPGFIKFPLAIGARLVQGCRRGTAAPAAARAARPFRVSGEP
jgi:hypothetical protein